ncbi:DUF808 domain-containing protein [bacterium]|nr:DUF808 domain-containing protein [bacterium]
MAAGNLLALFDDIASVLDDVALMTKKASVKTVGLMGDDLAVNSEQMIGLTASQELPVVKKIFWGAFLNKIILIPVVLGLSFYLPLVLTGTLLIGGLYLCYEGFEKVEEKLFHKKPDPTTQEVPISLDDRVEGAVKTDFILSAEILAIAASSMIGSSLLVTLLSLGVISVAVNILIYGSVLIIIKLDDLGLYIVKKSTNKVLQKLGSALISSSPYIMKCLGIIGTVATFLVGGGIFLHTFHLTLGFNSVLENLVSGVVLGTIVWGLIQLLMKLKPKKKMA